MDTKHDPICAANPDACCCICKEIQQVKDAEARRAANDVESLPYRDHGRTVNRNDAIMAARRGLPR